MSTHTTDDFRYEMYTDEGDVFVANALDHLVAQAHAGKFTSVQLLKEVQTMVGLISVVHPEVRDTEPEWGITDAVNTLICQPLRWQLISREDF